MIMVKTGFILIALFYATVHPFHISINDIEFDEEAKSVEIAQKIFTDDFEVALNAYTSEKIDLVNEDQKETNDALIKKYILENIQIEINGKPADFQFLGSQREDDAIWCFMEIPKTKKLKSIKVRNTLLFEMFEDQMNLVHVKKSDEIKSMRLIKDKSEDAFNYE